MKHKTGLSILLLVIALLASACDGGGAPQLVDPKGTDLQITTQIKSNGAGTFTLAFNEGYADNMGENLEDLCDQTAEESTTELNTEMEEHAGDPWCVGSIEFTGLQELEDDIFSQYGVRVEKLTLRKDALSIKVSYRNYEASDITCRLSLSGKWGDHNADDEEGNTLSWEVNQGTTKVMEAEGSVDKGGGINTAYIVAAVAFCCCSLLLVVIVGVILITMRRKKSASAAGF